jgi:hypothetical protein
MKTVSVLVILAIVVCSILGLKAISDASAIKLMQIKADLMLHKEREKTRQLEQLE